jgi:hypothetical protein
MLRHLQLNRESIRAIECLERPARYIVPGESICQCARTGRALLLAVDSGRLGIAPEAGVPIPTWRHDTVPGIFRGQIEISLGQVLRTEAAPVVEGLLGLISAARVGTATAQS